MQEKHNEHQIKNIELTPNHKEDSLSHLLIKGEQPISFSIDFSVDSDYQISGCAHFEDVDRENEVIAIKAIKESLGNFMKHPILHYQHTERPIGTFTECVIKGKALFVKANVYDTPDNADAWEEIKTGKLNAFSIYGKRKISSPECKLRPEQRMSPCRTDALDLWSISAVGRQVGTHEVNEHTFLDVVKAFADYYKNEDILIKADTTDSTLIHTTTDGTKGGRRKDNMEDEDVQKCNLNKGDAVEHYTENQEAPSGTSEVLKSDERNPSEIEKRLKGVEEILAKLVESDAKVHDTMDKATDEDTDGKREPMPVEKGEEEEEDKMEDTEEVQKATPVEEVVEKALVTEVPTLTTDIITKAQMDTFTKAINDELTLIKARIEKMETETIQKGGTVVVISEQVAELSSSERNANIFGV
jgi:hypothetical protein